MRRALLCCLMLAALGCGPEPAARAEPQAQDTATPKHVDEPEHEALPRLVKLTQQVVDDAKIHTVVAVREALPNTLALPGEIVADPDRSARLASPIAGRIAAVRFKEGSTVKKGDVLAVIGVPELGRLRSTQASASARAAAARANAQRLAELLRQQLTSEQAYQDAVANARALEEDAIAAREQLNALGLSHERDRPSQLTLRAPVAGVVVSRNAVIGQPVDADEVLAEIVDLSEVWFLGRVFEKDLGRLTLNTTVEVQLNAFMKERFDGVIEYIGRQVDPAARTVTARIRLENRSDRLRGGLFGTAFVSMDDHGTRTPTLVVPRSSLTELGGKQVVFVQHPDRDFEVHDVVVGSSAVGKVEIVSGLREGENVVDQGVFTLKSAVLKNTFAEDE